MVPPVNQRNLVGSTAHAKYIRVLDEDKCNRLFGSQKKVNMVEGVVANVDQQITKQRRKQLYVISYYKTPDGSVNRYSIHIKSVVSGPVLVPVPVNLPATAPILTVTTTTIIPDIPSTSVPDDHTTPVDPAPVSTTTTTTAVPALLPTTTTVHDNSTTISEPAPDPTITTTIPYNTTNHVVPEPDTTTTTCVYANPHTKNAHVPDPNPPPQK